MKLYRFLDRFPGAREDFDRKIGTTLGIAALIPPALYALIEMAIERQVQWGALLISLCVSLGAAVFGYLGIRMLLAPLEQVLDVLRRPLDFGTGRKLPTDFKDLLGEIMRDAESLAVRSERAATHIQERSLGDDLTGFHTRHSVKRRLLEDCARTDRGQMTLHVALLALVGAEEIVKTRGIGALEDTLKQVAQLLAMNVRKTDWLGRWKETVFIIGYCDNQNIEDTLSRTMTKLKGSAGAPGSDEAPNIRVWCGAAQYLAGTGPRNVLASAHSALEAVQIRQGESVPVDYVVARSTPDGKAAEEDLSNFFD